MKKEERTAKRIIIEYEDAPTREITKGFVAQFTENGDDDTFESTFDMVGMSGKDLELLVYSVIQLGMKLGLFGKEYMGPPPEPSEAGPVGRDGAPE